jgi:hypothetical protein
MARDRLEPPPPSVIEAEALLDFPSELDLPCTHQSPHRPPGHPLILEFVSELPRRAQATAPSEPESRRPRRRLGPRLRVALRRRLRATARLVASLLPGWRDTAQGFVSAVAARAQTVVNGTRAFTVKPVSPTTFAPFIGGTLFGGVTMLVMGTLSGEPAPQVLSRSLTSATATVQAQTATVSALMPTLARTASTSRSSQPWIAAGPFTPAESPGGLPWTRLAVPGTRRAASRISEGSVAIASRPQGGRVYLNNVPVGTTPLTLTRQRVGSRALRVEMDGYQRWSGVIQIRTGQRTAVAADLVVAPR